MAPIPQRGGLVPPQPVGVATGLGWCDLWIVKVVLRAAGNVMLYTLPV